MGGASIRTCACAKLHKVGGARAGVLRRACERGSEESESDDNPSQCARKVDLRTVSYTA